jgi:hypothetical protein
MIHIFIMFHKTFYQFHKFLEGKTIHRWIVFYTYAQEIALCGALHCIFHIVFLISFHPHYILPFLLHMQQSFSLSLGSFLRHLHHPHYSWTSPQKRVCHTLCRLPYGRNFCVQWGILYGRSRDCQPMGCIISDQLSRSLQHICICK